MLDNLTHEMAMAGKRSPSSKRRGQRPDTCNFRLDLICSSKNRQPADDFVVEKKVGNELEAGLSGVYRDYPEELPIEFGALYPRS